LHNKSVLPQYMTTSMELQDLRIDEPVTVLTNMILAAVCLYSFFRITKLEGGTKLRNYFRYYFLTFGLGAFFGGVLGHAFLYALSPPWKLVSWVLILTSVAILAQAMVVMARPWTRPPVARLVSWLNVSAFSLALFFTVRTLEFDPVQYYIAFGMVVLVGSLSYLVFRKTGSRGIVWIMAAVGTGIISALIFGMEWGTSPWFNHKDICHLIVSISVLLIFRGAARILTDVRTPD
jgi:ABC-type thiamin/hydroxymethylpyrimidine transport system permease subunit